MLIPIVWKTAMNFIFIYGLILRLQRPLLPPQQRPPQQRPPQLQPRREQQPEKLFQFRRAIQPKE